VKKILVALCFMGQILFASGMTLEATNNQLFATGYVGGNDYTQFKEAFENPLIDTVVFVNSPGGDLWTGITIGRMISARGYRTVAAGYCMSACSIMFMGGKERRFSDAFRPSFNVIGIHGAHDMYTKQIVGELQPQIYAFYKQMIGEKFNENIINQALYRMDDAGGMLRIFETARAPQTTPYQCPSVQTPRKDCTDYKAESGLTLGVLTHNDVAAINLPAAFKQAPAVLGKTLDRVFASLETHIDDLVERQCLTELCKTNAKKWITLKENRAIAGRVNGPGLGWQSDADAAVTSLVRAVYQCNHFRGAPTGLCQAEAVNSFDVRWMYSQAEREHKEALASLKIPANRFYANEEFGGGFTKAEGFKTQRHGDMTPKAIDGITTIGTQDLAKALLGEKPPAIIEVWGAVNEVVPTSKSLVNGGFAFENPAGEGFYSKRFVALLALLAPDKNWPIVFYCAGRECWLAVNAAMRAKVAGYTQVQWYRGGYVAWKAAGLPTALIAVTAVAN
jgi:rhodanese-related sulfurtransferase